MKSVFVYLSKIILIQNHKEKREKLEREKVDRKREKNKKFFFGEVSWLSCYELK